MKTPMQEHIEWLKGEHKKYTDQAQKESSMQILGYAFKIDDCIKHAELMLEEEKEVMSQVYADGGDWDEVPQPRFKNYYNQTFNTKEK